MNTPSSLARIRIILSHPSHPGNIGAAARAMKTMGLSRLTLVSPKRFPDEEATARASGAGDVLAHAQVCTTLDEALADVVRVAGMTARRRDLAVPFHWAREGATALIQEIPQDRGVQTQTRGGRGDVALLFGNETAGLTNEELARCHLGIMVPANPEYSSLNLGAAVQLMCYELRMAAIAYEALEASGALGAPPQGEGLPATMDEIEGLHAHWEQVAVTTGFLDPAHPKRLMPRLRRLFARARLEHDEVSILRGFLSTVEQPRVRRKK